MTDPSRPDAPVPEGVEDPLGPPAAGGPELDGTDGPDLDTAPPTEAPAADGAGAAAEPAESDPGAPAADGTGDRHSSTVEELIVDLERTTQERDAYLDQLRRNQAEFENAKKRLTKHAADTADRSTEALVEKLLPVLDACDSAIHHGAAEVEPVFATLLGTLEKDGLERINPVGEAFDPNLHEAVMHEPAADDSDDGTVVSDVMRPGYAWKGRVVRPAMVKVRG